MQKKCVDKVYAEFKKQVAEAASVKGTVPGFTEVFTGELVSFAFLGTINAAVKSKMISAPLASALIETSEEVIASLMKVAMQEKEQETQNV